MPPLPRKPLLLRRPHLPNPLLPLASILSIPTASASRKKRAPDSNIPPLLLLLLLPRAA
jgi:hypothetical protein